MKPCPLPFCAALLFLVGLALSGCALFGCPNPDGYRGVVCHNREAEDELRVGMPRNEVVARFTWAAVAPPWHNDFGVGPETIKSPLDTLSIESPIGDRYEIVRVPIAMNGVGRCPLIRGYVDLLPLVFFGERLVAWSWDDLEAVVKRKATEEERSLQIAWLCDSAAQESS